MSTSLSTLGVDSRQATPDQSPGYLLNHHRQNSERHQKFFMNFQFGDKIT